MIGKKFFIELNEENVSYRDKNRNLVSYSLDEFNTEYINIKNKNLYVILTGEEILIKIIKIPKVRKDKLHSIVKQELVYIFKNIDNILFNYDVYKDCGSNLEVLVFCLKWNKDNFLKKWIDTGNSLKAIYPIQFYLFDVLKKKTKIDNHIIVFYYRYRIYLLKCENSKIIQTGILRNLNSSEIKDSINEFILRESLKECVYQPEIFFINFPYKKVKKEISVYYKCKDIK